jgi:hypothetical protein
MYRLTVERVASKRSTLEPRRFLLLSGRRGSCAFEPRPHQYHGATGSSGCAGLARRVCAANVWRVSLVCSFVWRVSLVAVMFGA